MSFKPILQPGRNCWRIRHADRVKFLIDGDAYFSVLHDALQQARSDIMILSWDIYSDIKLGALKGDHRSLAKLLDDVLKDNEQLHAHILNWDFIMLFAMSREWLPLYKLGWATHPRLKFEMDAQHPVAGSHHQKLVVLDDAMAFNGGLDITRGRWDTPEHRASDERRQKIDGSTGRPYHDVQMAVSGDIARALGDLARERWRHATDSKIEMIDISEQTKPLWPDDLEPDLEDVDVAIARTSPGFDDYQEVREVEQLYLDSIEAAQDYIYIENQYFTSPIITDALAKRLQDKDGPEIIINLPLETEGWLAQHSMDVIRVKLLTKLNEADKHKKLKVFYPYKKDLQSIPINLHAKLMICDDRFVRVGSANLNNRSMSLDTECDLAIECRHDDERIKKGIIDFRDRLLAEHLGVEQEAINQSITNSQSLIKGIDAHRKNSERSLKPLLEKLPDYSESVLTQEQLVDPAQEIDVEELMYHFLPVEDTSGASRRITGWLVALVVLLGLAAAWRYTSLAQWLDIGQVTAVIENIRSNDFAPVLLVIAFIVAGLLMVPVTVLIIASVIVFDPLTGSVYALASAVGCALAGYALGSMLGSDAIKHLAGGRINRISQQLAKRGVFTVVILRIVPVAPFTVINLVAGASHINFRDFALGTLLGLVPGVTAIALLTDRVRATMDDPQAGTIALLVAVAALVLGGGYMLSRYLIRQRK